MSTVSIAWLEADGSVVSYAFPFDQGPFGKGEYQPGLFEQTNPNLDESEWLRLLAWLSRRKLVCHHAKFDMHMLRAGTREWEGWDLSEQVVWDTQLANRELWPIESTSLKPTATRLGLLGTGEEAKEQEVIKAELKRRKLTMGSMDRLPWAVMKEYARVDAELTILLHRRQIELFEAGEASWNLMQIEMDLFRALFRMECRGVGFDRPAALAAASILRSRLAALADRLPFKPTPDGARAHFFPPGGRLPDRRTPGGKPVVDEEQIRDLMIQRVPWATEWAEYTKLVKALGMWYQGYAEACGPDGRLRTSYKQVRVVSGRMSSERVNLQAIPKDDKMSVMPEGVPGVRDLFVAKPGYVLWNLDLSQAELRVASEFAKCRLMLDLLAEGADLHGITCQEVLGVEPGAPDWKQKRDIAKRLTFGGIFQIGPVTFRATLKKIAGIEISSAQSEAYITRWRSMYPEFGREYQRHQYQAKHQGYVTLQSGRQSWFGPLDFPNTAWSRRVQGSLAEFNKVWVIEVERRVQGALVLNVHDSVVLELPLGERGEAIAGQVAEMTTEMAKRFFGIKMPVDVTPWRKESR